MATALSPLNYIDAASINPDPGSPIPLVELYGASVLEGSNDIQPYRDIHALFTEFCEDFKKELGEAALVFSAIPPSQIAAGRARGGNAIDAPRGGFHAIQFSLSLPLGVQNRSAALEQGRQNFFKKYVSCPLVARCITKRLPHLARLRLPACLSTSVKVTRTRMFSRHMGDLNF